MNHLVTSALAAAVLVACGAGSPPARSASSSTCADLAASARAEVAGAIASHADCRTDADCVQTSLGASCFDSCARAVSASAGGPAAVDAAVARVDADQCRRFKEQGCHFDVPPCVPPGQPRCSAGRCTL